jgi:hypothetical protein
MLFKEVIAVYIQSHKENQQIKNVTLLTVKADGSYSYRSALKVSYWETTDWFETRHETVSAIAVICDH